MDEIMKCPACAEEIPIGTKKCEHCGEDILKQCPCCKEWIVADAKRCKHCGTWLNKFTKEEFEGKTASDGEVKSSSNNGEVRFFVYIESMLVIYLLSEMIDLNWWTIAIIACVNISLLAYSFYRVIYNIAVSALWGLIGLSVAPLLLGESEFEIEMRMATENFGSYWWVALIAFLVSIGIHAGYMTKEN